MARLARLALLGHQALMGRLVLWEVTALLDLLDLPGQPVLMERQVQLARPSHRSRLSLRYKLCPSYPPLDQTQ